MAFKGEDEYVPNSGILLELTEIENGNVELGFNAPLPGNPRIYLSFVLADLIAQVMTKAGEGK